MEPFIQILNGFSLLSKSARGKGWGMTGGCMNGVRCLKTSLLMPEMTASKAF